MLKATKANRVLRIADEQKDNYLKMGYTITDMMIALSMNRLTSLMRLKNCARKTRP